MREMARRHLLIGDVRGLGLLMGIELVRDRNTLKRATEEAEQVMSASLRRGLNFKVTMGNILTLTPALIISQAELNQALDILDDCIGEVETAQKV
jgi:4-aminobutyrate aminotransferase